MRFGREVMQMLLDGKKVASIALMTGYDDAYLALDAEDVLTCYYREYGVGKSSEWADRGWRELPTDSTDAPQCTCHGCRLGSSCVKAFEAGTGKGWPVDSKEQANKAIPKIEYTVTINPTMYGLEQDVNEHIEKGWRPSGGVCYANKGSGSFVQAMTREV